jgi:hypothetical protein
MGALRRHVSGRGRRVSGVEDEESGCARGEDGIMSQGIRREGEVFCVYFLVYLFRSVYKCFSLVIRALTASPVLNGGNDGNDGDGGDDDANPFACR